MADNGETENTEPTASVTQSPQPTATSTAASTAAPTPTPAQGPRVRWNTENLKSSYANVCTLTSTREEVVLNFGLNHDWERNSREMAIELSHRVILSPFAAQRLLDSLSRVMKEYEAKHGGLRESAPERATSPAPETKQ